MRFAFYILLQFFLITILPSCSLRLYKYCFGEYEQYIIQKKSNITFLYPASKDYSLLDSSLIETNADSINLGSIDFDVVEFQGVKKSFNITTKDESIIIKTNENFDTLFFSGKFQKNKNIQFVHNVTFPFYSMSNGIYNLSMYSGLYSYKYIGVRIACVKNHFPEKIRRFEFYPSSIGIFGRLDGNKSIGSNIDTLSYSHPITIDFSYQTGVPLKVSYSVGYISDGEYRYSNFLESIECVGYKKINISKSKLIKILQ